MLIWRELSVQLIRKGTAMAKESTSKPSTAAITATQVPKERAMFRALLTGNPNYFGNLGNSPLLPVLPKQGDTTFEEIG
jgi:hypothetical protein